MQDNQYPMEVARDIITLLGRMAPGQKLKITVKRHKSGNTNLLDWDSSMGVVYGSSETARAIGRAYYGEQYDA